MTEPLQTLIEQLSHPDRNVRSEAALSLGKLGDPSAVDALLKALVADSDLFVREDITWALVRLGDFAVQPLIDLLQDANPAARHHAAHALGKIGDKRAVEPLINALNDDDRNVLLKSAFTLGQFGDVKAIPALINLLGHGDTEVQSMIDNVLERFGASTLQPLIDSLDHERWQVREQAADILGLIGDQDVVPLLIDMLDDPEWQVRFAAMNALNHIGGIKSKKAIMGMGNDSDERVRALIPKLVKRSRPNMIQN